MPIRTSDLKFVWGNTQNVIPSNQLHALFGQLSGAGSRDGQAEQVLIAIANTNNLLTMSNVKVWISSLDGGGSIFEIALDPAGPVAYPGPTGTDNPTLTYATPTSEAAGLASPRNLGPLQQLGIWVRRRGNGPGSSERWPENNTLTVSGTSPA